MPSVRAITDFKRGQLGVECLLWIARAEVLARELYMSSLRLTLLLSLSSALLYADADRQDWIGTYALNYDGHGCTLHILQSKRKCRKAMPCSGLEADYTDDQGSLHSASVDTLDDNGRHLAFTVELSGNRQIFHLYIFNLDKSKLAGTATMGDQTVGVFAEKVRDASAPTRDNAGTPSPPTGVRVASDERSPRDKMKASVVPQTPPQGLHPPGTPTASIAADGSLEWRYPDGTVESKRIGSKCWETRYPDGHTKPANCLYAGTMVLVPPAPPPGSKEDEWLNTEEDALLDILQKILGGSNSSSFQNYLQNNPKSPQTSLYKRIGLRTIAIEELAHGPK